jgi:predicted membrane protein
VWIGGQHRQPSPVGSVNTTPVTMAWSFLTSSATSWLTASLPYRKNWIQAEVSMTTFAMGLGFFELALAKLAPVVLDLEPALEG